MDNDIEKRHIIKVTEDAETVTVVFAKMPDAENMLAEAPVEDAAAEYAPMIENNTQISDRKMPSERVFRSAEFDRASVNEIDRRVTLAFSSEMQVERGFGIEILDHSATSINKSFIGSGRAPVLVDHDPTDQVGVVESMILGSDRVARAVVRFGKSSRAEEIWQDVKDGIRGNVSVGYTIDEMVADGKQEGRDVYRAVSWTPLEISIVSIPADQSVGIGRALEATTISLTTKETPKMENVILADDGIKAERTRASAILELASRHNARDFGEQAVRDGVSIDQFRGALLEKVGNKPLNLDASIGLNDKEIKRFSFVKAIRALSNPQDQRAQADAAFEFEAGIAAASREGRQSRGITVPMDVLKRDQTAGTNSAGGFIVQTDVLSGSFIDVLRNKMVLNQLGATFLTGLQGNVAIPRKSAGATSYWVAENVAPTEGSLTFEQLSLTPKTVAAYIDFSRKLSYQSSMDVESMVRNDLASSIAIALDSAAINGTGSSNQPTGILATSGIGSYTIGANGGAPTWAMVAGLVQEVEIDNALTGSAAFLTNGQVKAKMSVTGKQSSGVEGNFLLGPDLNNLYGYPIVISQQVPATLTKGSSSGVCSAMLFGVWSDLIVAQWSGIDLMVDPYTGSNAGTVRVVAFHDCDIGLRHVESFAECNEITTT